MIKSVVAIVLAISALFCAPASARQPESVAVAKAKASAIQWLALVDTGKYVESWQQAAGYFQSSISETSWQRAVGNVRKPLGKVNSRTLMSADFTHTLPGAPDGNYVVIQFATRFEHKASAIETLTPLQEKDGSWKVSGYYVK
ncbi:MAG: DUF4019 domain-containing protein [Rhodanobacteraceae bacterium]